MVGNFLVYREVVRKTAPPKSLAEYNFPSGKMRGKLTKDEIVLPRGPLSSTKGTYYFKQGGLIKKTFSMMCEGSQWHLVCYYTMADVEAGLLHTPSEHAELKKLKYDIAPVVSGNHCSGNTHIVNRSASLQVELERSPSSTISLDDRKMVQMGSNWPMMNFMDGSISQDSNGSDGEVPSSTLTELQPLWPSHQYLQFDQYDFDASCQLVQDNWMSQALTTFDENEQI